MQAREFGRSRSSVENLDITNQLYKYNDSDRVARQISCRVSKVLEHRKSYRDTKSHSKLAGSVYRISYVFCPLTGWRPTSAKYRRAA